MVASCGVRPASGRRAVTKVGIGWRPHAVARGRRWAARGARRPLSAKLSGRSPLPDVRRPRAAQPRSARDASTERGQIRGRGLVARDGVAQRGGGRSSRLSPTSASSAPVDSWRATASRSAGSHVTRDPLAQRGEAHRRPRLVPVRPPHATRRGRQSRPPGARPASQQARCPPPRGARPSRAARRPRRDAASWRATASRSAQLRPPGARRPRAARRSRQWRSVARDGLAQRGDLAGARLAARDGLAQRGNLAGRQPLSGATASRSAATLGRGGLVRARPPRAARQDRRRSTRGAQQPRAASPGTRPPGARPASRSGLDLGRGGLLARNRLAQRGDHRQRSLVWRSDGHAVAGGGLGGERRPRAAQRSRRQRLSSARPALTSSPDGGLLTRDGLTQLSNLVGRGLLTRDGLTQGGAISPSSGRCLALERLAQRGNCRPRGEPRPRATRWR